ncbi:hypothetical protein L6164_024193 [Bauhinia variegata]|uniref:Uncharacterized protein n=1 Tax=Bauhinia variegata TaxID=167791 RepID=A0ACB9LYB3_BAUVA|nr:hypothetical protein L6164_024193 [Bauhinia variegata]
MPSASHQSVTSHNTCSLCFVSGFQILDNKIMKPTATVDVDLSGKRVSFSDNLDRPNEEQHQTNAPLLLQPSYARSKSMIFDELRNFRTSLKWCALDHSSSIGKLISFVLFIILAILVPLLSSLCIQFSASSPDDDPISFNKLVHIPESGLAIIGFLTLSCFFRRYGLRQLLLLDGLQEDSMYVRRGYTRELEKAFRRLAYIILPSFFLELAHKIIFFSGVKVSVPYISAGFPLNSTVFVLVLVSWVYRTGVFLLVCVLFRLTCELQILRFEGLHKLFEGCGSDAIVIFGEHVRIKKQLWVTSHRYRFFIIGCLITITVSQLGALLLVLATKYEKTFFNSGDLVICSAVQLCGTFLCLIGATRITHRAQGIVSIATKWHMVATIASAESEQWKTQVPDAIGSDTDSDPSDICITVTTQQPCSFQTREALVTYLQHNHGGITLYGYALDRGLLHTLFAFEFSLLMWILSKVVVLSSTKP